MDLTQRMHMDTLPDRVWHLRLRGPWLLANGMVDGAAALALGQGELPQRLVVDGRAVQRWDSALIAFLRSMQAAAEERKLPLELAGFAAGVIALLELTHSAPPSGEMIRAKAEHSLVEAVGHQVADTVRVVDSFMVFVGDVWLSLLRLVRGQAKFRSQDLWQFVAHCGPGSLGIVTLISVLLGMILAFVGAVQLERFGASIYVASLVGLAMAREMAAMMTAIIMTGHTGAAYAAQIGSMQVNEEVDALRTMGVSPMDYLVLPRFLALVAMMPILTVYANVMGILGGAGVSMVMLDITWTMYIQQMMSSVALDHFLIGLFKSVLFAALVAVSGCYMGLNCGRSATAVGQSTTRAVVLGIVLIIIVDSVVTIVTSVLDI